MFANRLFVSFSFQLGFELPFFIFVTAPTFKFGSLLKNFKAPIKHLSQEFLTAKKTLFFLSV